MFPVGDDNTQRRTTPYVTYTLVGLNILVFFVELAGGDRFIEDWAFIPARFSGNPEANAVTIFSAMFMHGGFMHLFGNMLFLWIFGDNLEDRVGHARYLVFYLLCGVLASLAHVATTVACSEGGSGLLVPSLGASGAISGVLGGYILLFPRNRVHVIILRIFTTVPAYVALGLWFLFQFISGLGMLGGGAQEGGVAYAAHIDRKSTRLNSSHEWIS